jgi:hypothetical protein
MKSQEKIGGGRVISRNLDLSQLLGFARMRGYVPGNFERVTCKPAGACLALEKERREKGLYRNYAELHGEMVITSSKSEHGTLYTMTELAE